ncbi:MAG: type II toxin-antitoxin system VapC family toxin [Armatimonadetes bacterium]|nr:type II toxin-antitoxin system VapC family toxin [Armatimonadota bacterium]
MRYVYLDPSAWVKRYVAETGSEVMDILWAELGLRRGQAFCHWLGLTELVWVLQRRRNAGVLEQRAFSTVYQQFQHDCEQVKWLALSWEQVQASVVWIVKYNLNATDALHLQVALAQREQGMESMCFVSADRRLLRAAQSEGLACLDVERSAASQVQALFDARL